MIATKQITKNEKLNSRHNIENTVTHAYITYLFNDADDSFFSN